MKNYDFMFPEHFLRRFFFLWTNFLSFLLCRSEVVASSNFYVQSSEKLCLKVKSAIINQNKFALKTFRSSRRPKKGFRLAEAICDFVQLIIFIAS